MKGIIIYGVKAASPFDRELFSFKIEIVLKFILLLTGKPFPDLLVLCNPSFGGFGERCGVHTGGDLVYAANQGASIQITCEVISQFIHSSSMYIIIAKMA